MRGVSIVYAVTRVLVMRRSGVRLPKAAPISARQRRDRATVGRFVERTWNHSCVRHLLIAAPTVGIAPPCRGGFQLSCPILRDVPLGVGAASPCGRRSTTAG